MKTQLLVEHFSHTVERITTILPTLRFINNHDAVHELRINIRTQRVLLSLFPEDKAMIQHLSVLKNTAKLTNPIRDIDVSIALANDLYLSTHEGERVIHELHNAKVASYPLLLRTIDIPNAIHLQYQLRDLWDDNMQVVSYAALRRLAMNQIDSFKKTLQAMSELDSDTRTIEEWHQCRILIKKLRYSYEGFNGLFMKAQVCNLPLLTKLQKQLGLFHDYAVFREVVENMSVMPITWRYRLGHYEAETLRHAAELLADLKKRW